MIDILVAALHGILLAMGLILPLGVQNIFIFNQGATQKNIFSALPSVITAATCDTILIVAAISGMSTIFLDHPLLKLTVFIAGFIFLTYMGFVTWNKKERQSTEGKALTTKKQIIFAISVSILNPHAIIYTIAVIGTNSLHYNSYAKIAFASSCIFVSWSWFIFLAIFGRVIQNIDKSGKYLYFINKLAAIIVWIIAFYMLIAISQLDILSILV
jgi:L-lysine exporter family protein LysE/ArgO